MNKDAILRVENLSVEFGKGKNKFKAVDNVSFDIYKGEIFGLVGESGSGKTTIGRAIIRLNENSGGNIIFEGEDIAGKLKREKEQKVKKDIQMIFQDPIASLNERAKVDYIISEGVLNLNKNIGKEEIKKKVDRALLDVGLLPEFSSRFPHEFSGGQRQRVGIARALIMEPKFIIADEPISALDVSIRAQVLNLLLKLQKNNNLTYLFIAHDLSVVKFITDRVGVIYKGKIVEMAPTEELFKNAIHPYTKSLLSAIPLPDPLREKRKRLKIYDPKIHNYVKQPPKWVEIEKEHFILANEIEINKYKKRLK
ncbi:MAG: ATP-binding cassette domain-containing protein [Tissierella sp.]|uniref:ATP-binding cassette domain-containing protein n=1 Tax=Tissierella sp. TaxID=41274 RepID=UPI003F9DC336